MATDRQFNSQTFGEHGFTYTADTTPVTGGNYFCLYVLTAASVTVACNNSTALTTVSLPAGATLYGIFTGYTLASGSVIAYKQSS